MKTVEAFLKTVLIAAAIIFAFSGLSWAMEGTNPLYAAMEKTDGRYVITKVSNQPLLFRLNDLEPQFDVRSYYCTQRGGKFVMEVLHPEMCRNDEKTFRKLKTNGERTLANDFLTIIRDALTGEFEECSVFDAGEYGNAVQEALLNSGLKRDRLIRRYDEFMAEVKAMKKKRESEYNRRLQEGLDILFSVSIEDRSGIYKNDLTASDLVSIEMNDLPDFDGKTIQFSAYDAASVKEVLEGMKKAYESELDRLTAYGNLVGKDVAQGYTLRVEGPDTIDLKDGGRQIVNLKVIVFSRTFPEFSPPYANEDDNLRIEDDGKAIILFNRTGRFIQVESLTAKYGEQVMQSLLNLDMAPGSFISLGRLDARLHLPRRGDYFQATKESLAGLSLSMGYDVKYRILGEGSTRSLQKIETQQMLDMVK